ncbi:hypothetical protein KOW79_016616 [Hemibagrus wyckioides]|uniref:Uncharacterized protein n=1 Tax=Hemibagrus wyckioides TaxID=337641 RepID=A0A9D3SHB1_9TELE|nr:hypothetical protein KOW79_016616 [Hemibagrus wyckioides]
MSTGGQPRPALAAFTVGWTEEWRRPGETPDCHSAFSISPSAAVHLQPSVNSSRVCVCLYVRRLLREAVMDSRRGRNSSLFRINLDFQLIHENESLSYSMNFSLSASFDGIKATGVYRFLKRGPSSESIFDTL